MAVVKTAKLRRQVMEKTTVNGMIMNKSQYYNKLNIVRFERGLATRKVEQEQECHV